MKTYSSYKDSDIEWIGDIPSHWDTPKLKYLVKIGNGKSFSDIEVEKGGYPVLGTGGEFSRCSDYLYEGPSVLLGRKGTIDKPQIIFEPFWTSDTLYYTIIGDEILPILFYHLVKQIPFDLYSYGSTIPSMTKTDYEEMRFPIPPLPEQKKIVSFLDDKTSKIVRLIQSKQRKIQLLKEKRTGIINEVVTKGLNPDVEMKDSGVEWIGEIPSHWYSTLFKRVTEKVIVGIAESTTGSYTNDKDSVPIIRSTNIKESQIKGEVYRIKHELSKKNKTKILRKGDLVTVRTGNTGMTSVVPEEYDGSQCFTLLISSLNSDNNPYYFNYLINSQAGIEYFRITSWGTAQNNISVPILENLRIVIPPLKEQNQIVEYLDSETKTIDETVQLEEQKIKLLKEYKQSLISEVVTGKVNVQDETGEVVV